MKQLYYEKNRQFIILLLMFVFCANSTFAQKKFIDNKWPKEKIELPELSESFKDRDAVFLTSEETFRIKIYNYRFTSYKKVHQRIKILTKTGLDKYAKIVLPKFDNLKYGVVDARTIKQNGDIIDLKSKEIKEVDYSNEDDFFDKSRFLLFAIPGVEVGDVIEIIYYVNFDGILSSDYVYLHSYLPSQKATYKFEKSNVLGVDIRMYNEMKQPDIKTSDEKIVYTWEMENLDGYFGQTGAIPARQLPYISLIVRSIQIGGIFDKVEGLTEWSDYPKAYAKAYRFDKNAIGGEYKKVKEIILDLVKDIPSNQKKKRMERIINYTVENLTITDTHDNSNSILKQLQNKNISFLNCSKFYDYALYIFELKYYMVLGKNFENGPIDYDFPSYNQVNEIAFAFYDENNDLNYLCASSEQNSYYLNELPISLQATAAVLIELSGEDYSELTKKIPSTKLDVNKRIRKIKASVDLKGKIISHSVNEKISGGYAIRSRKYYMELNNSDEKIEKFGETLVERNENAKLESMEIDSLHNTYPYPLELTYDYSETDIINEVDANTYSLNIENWFWRNNEKIETKFRSMDYYVDFPYFDKYDYILTFDQPIELLNAENLNVNVNSEHGNFTLTVNQVNETTLLVSSLFKVNKARWPLADIEELAAIIEASEISIEEPVLFEVK